jgi:hypothetical protein
MSRGRTRWPERRDPTGGRVVSAERPQAEAMTATASAEHA